MHQYQVLTTFRSGGYTDDHRYLGTRSMYGSPQKGRTPSISIAPVHGAPMRARDTLLATLLASSTGFQVLRNDYADQTNRALLDLRHHLKCSRPNPKPSAMDRASKSKSLMGKLIGVEVEFYPSVGLPSKMAGGLGDVTSDGSLGSGGREIRRMTWASNGGRLPGVLNLGPLLKDGWVNKKCGLHVHIDVRHLPQPGCGTTEICSAAETYDRLVMLYPFLKKLVPKSRLRNTYCKWVPNRPDHPSASTISTRYAALNWQSYREHGSFEFRMAAGSTNIVKIESWALVCQHLVRYCSLRSNRVPSSWKQFLATMPGWMASWCALRQLKLTTDVTMDERTASAVDFSASTSTPVE